MKNPLLERLHLKSNYNKGQISLFFFLTDVSWFAKMTEISAQLGRALFDWKKREKSSLA